MKRKNNAVFLTRGAAIAAIYVILTYISHILGLASGPIQLRLSEALCILPFFFSEAVGGLAVGCLVVNLLTGAAIWDVFFGAFATFIGALGARALKKISPRLMWLTPLPTVLSNALIIPLVLRYAYGVPDALPYLILTVGVGEILSAWVLGLILCSGLKRTALFKK